MASMFTGFDSYKLSKVKVTDQVLGRGSYATVLEVKYKGERCAGKKIHDVLLTQGINVYAVRRFEEECRLLSQVKHPNIVQFVGVYFHKNADLPILVMEHLPTDLTSFIEREGILAKGICYSILHDVAQGFSYLHSQTPPIIHRDLSSNNILLSTSMNAKISDLGVAKILDLTPLQVSHMTQTPGTPAYMPPEVMIANPRYDTSVDEFSYGVLTIHILCGLWPEPQSGQIRTESGGRLVAVSEAERRKVFLDMIGDDHPLMELILQCISNDPHLRPSVRVITKKLAQMVQLFPCDRDYRLTLRPGPMEIADSKKKRKRPKEKAKYTLVSNPIEEGENEIVRSCCSIEEESVAKPFLKQQDSVSTDQQSYTKELGQARHGPSDSSGLDTEHHPLYTVKYSYESRACDDMSLKKGEKLCIINTKNQDWWRARSLTSGKEGYVPSNYLTKLSNPIYTATCDYVSYKDDELSFKKGAELAIIHTGDGYWWYARFEKDGREGFVPSNYLIEMAYPTYVATYNYESRTDRDLGFKRNDLLCVINTDDEDWWFARSKETGEEGYIPSNYVAEANSLNVHKWYYGDISRTEAEKLLYGEGNRHGSFLIRDSETVPGGHSLSIRDMDKVKHYKIRHKRDSEAFFIVPHITFESIADLVIYYQGHLDGICVILRHPCVSLEKARTAGLSKFTNSDWEIERKQIRLVNKLGSGSFAQVWGGVWNGTTSVAVKALKTGSSMTESDFLREATLMKELRHLNILQLYGICSKEQPIYIVTELMKHGCLLEYLRNERRSLKLSQLISMALQVAEGMVYLEEHQYIHRDLAARNVLVGDGLICKISDFGLTQSVEEAKNKAGDVTKFAIKWTAPEALLHNKFSVKSDVWSFGILLYEIITFGRFPYAGMTNEEVMQKLEQRYRMPQPKESSYAYYNIMLKCWREEPENRPTFEALQWELEEFLESTR